MQHPEMPAPPAPPKPKMPWWLPLAVIGGLIALGLTAAVAQSSPTSDVPNAAAGTQVPVAASYSPSFPVYTPPPATPTVEQRCISSVGRVYGQKSLDLIIKAKNNIKAFRLATAGTEMEQAATWLHRAADEVQGDVESATRLHIGADELREAGKAFIGFRIGAATQHLESGLSAFSDIAHLDAC